MPLAYCFKNKLVYLVVHPKEATIYYPSEND